MATRRAADRAAADLTFEELYRGHRADVYRAALRELGDAHEAEDVTQAAFVDAYRAVLRGTEPQSPRAWLLAISENVRRRRFRTSQRRPREEPLDVDSPVAAEIPYAQARALGEALAELPSEQRRVFVLRELGGLSYDEIAEEVGSTVGAIQMLLFRARRSLREVLDPPVVARRRTGILVPVPGWLTSLFSRVEVATLTPRAAGAVGATVLAVAGAGVAVSEAPADRVPLPGPGSRQPAAAVAPSQAAAAQPATRVATGTVTAPTIAGAAVRAQPTAAPAAPAAAPVPETSAPFLPAPTATPDPAAPTPTASATPTVVPVLDPVLDPVLEPALEPLPATVGAVETLIEPVPVPEPLAPVIGLATGAAGAAGAGIPPLPVPLPPPGALPPLP